MMNYLVLIVCVFFQGVLASESAAGSDCASHLAVAITTKDYGFVNNHLATGARVDAETLKKNFSMCCAAKDEQWHLVTSLLEAKADIAVCNDHLTPLFCAVRSPADCHALVIDLLQARADPNATDKHALTPLMWAVALKHAKNVQALLVYGAHPDQLYDLSVRISDDGRLAKFFLIHYGFRFSDVLSLSSNQNLFIKDDATFFNARHQFSPLFLSAFRGSLPILKSLLIARANPKQLCAGSSVVDIAQQNKHGAVVELLNLALNKCESLRNRCKYVLRLAVPELYDDELIYNEPSVHEDS